jgi:ABC-type Mn2+/Zn2+ transport system permease subunit
MLDALTDPFELAIGQRALVEVILLGAVCGPLGVWVVLYERSYAAESLAHATLPGLVIASLAGVSLALGAAGGLIVAAIAIWLAGRELRVGADVAIAVAVTSLVGIGVLLALSPDVPPRLGELLFGDPLSVSAGNLAGSAVLVVLGLVALSRYHRRLLVSGFDAIGAASLGAKPDTSRLALLGLIALTTLVAVQALGNLLVVALVVAPAAAALRIVDRIGSAYLTATAIAVGSGIAGIYASYYLDLAAGASIALAAVGAFLATLPFGGARAQRVRSGSRGRIEILPRG